MPFRAFVALPVPADDALARLHASLAASGADLKLARLDALHLTLSFLGNAPDDAAAPIGAALARATAGQAPFTLTLRGAGAFPDARRPRVVWAGVDEGAQALSGLARRVRDELRDAGFPGDDKPFRAHVTLGRVRSPSGASGLTRVLHEHAEDALGRLRVDEVHLYRSTLTPRGAQYEVLASAPLSADVAQGGE